jgi:GrpB-like predicted nucleotidyltransferase (UPF0157 family)
MEKIMLNSKDKPIIIEPYDPEWKNTFEDLSTTLFSKLQDDNILVEHVGSTSIKGCSGKPIIDLVIIIQSVNNFDKISKKLGELGYVHVGDRGIGGREAFKRRDDTVPFTKTRKNWMEHHLYVCTWDNLELKRMIKFRDYLRTHPISMKNYVELKVKLADKFRNERDLYTSSKTQFIQEILKKIEI